MNSTKTMLLVPPELHAKLKRDNLSDLDKEMHEILFGESVSDDMKWKLYSQCLQRYLHHSRDLNKVVEYEIKNKDVIDPVREQKHLSLENKHLIELEAVLPVDLRQRGKDLYKVIHDSNVITWNKRGELKIDDKIVRGSNIVDFVSVGVKPKQGLVPKGFNRFAEILDDSDIPLHYFGPNILGDDDEEEGEAADDQNADASISSSIHRTPAIANRSQKRTRTQRVPYQHTWEKYDL
jgi:hypothetical protein